MEFPKRYQPADFEERWYQYWQDRKLFFADPRSAKKAYSITIPPPNVTGSLHLGHALNNTLQDIMIRKKKLEGYEILWLPGTDHASIGTHNQIEKVLAREGKTRFDVGRDEFLKLAWTWKEKYGSTIIEQLKKLGCACDWTRLRFTMDPMLSRAVREAFVRYYEKGLIYRSEYLVNWCPRCHTAISDLEVKHKELPGQLWFIKYPIKNSSDYVVVATTRPETMLGDTAVAVHPDDERYARLHGKTALLPLTEREIPIVTEELVDREFGTGAVKVTPAHDPVDFEIGKKKHLEFIKVIDEDGQMTDKVPPRYQELTREAAREMIIQDLTARGLLEKIEPYRLNVGTCERCETVIEPLPSLQWFLKMAPLTGPAISAVKDGRVELVPERWTKVYLDWMDNIKDWCISRQLWWGHRIPVFYCDECHEIMVSREDPKECNACHGTKIRQDEDILDTWFSSALWPFSTMGWPEATDDLQKFYPTDFLSTAPEILYLWVARMIFSGLEFMGDIPFKKVYFHSVILSEGGERMSRSKGIGVDPLELIDKYGTDALRFTVAYLETQSQSYRFWEQKVEIGRNFANKIWNAARLIHPYLAESRGQRAESCTPIANSPISGRQSASDCKVALDNFERNQIDRWLIARYNGAVKTVSDSIERCNYGYAASELYKFLWHEFCDWFLEFAKGRMDSAAVTAVLHEVFSGSLRLLHPFMPFITEELWHRFGFDPESIMESSWPSPVPVDETGVERVESLKDVITAVRNIRAELGVPPKTPVECQIKTPDTGLASFLIEHSPLVQKLAAVASVRSTIERPACSSVAVFANLEVYVPLAGIIDITKEGQRLGREQSALKKELEKIAQRLTNDEFLSRAPTAVVDKEQEKKRLFEEKLERLNQALAALR
jgi:valyl-tRNA synthetase